MLGLQRWCWVVFVQVLFRSERRNKRLFSKADRQATGITLASSRHLRKSSLHHRQTTAPPTPEAAIACASVPRVLLSPTLFGPSPLAFPAFGDTLEPTDREAQPSSTSTPRPSPPPSTWQCTPRQTAPPLSRHFANAAPAGTSSPARSRPRLPRNRRRNPTTTSRPRHQRPHPSIPAPPSRTPQTSSSTRRNYIPSLG